MKRIWFSVLLALALLLSACAAPAAEPEKESQWDPALAHALGLTQEELCEGLCEPATLSRIENGRQAPSRSRANALLQRLGLPNDRYYVINIIYHCLDFCILRRNAGTLWERLRQAKSYTALRTTYIKR